MFEKVPADVLFLRPRITELSFHLYAQQVHPELFAVCRSRTIEREQYSLELNITTDGHVIRFRHGKMILTEVSAGRHRLLPESRRLLRQPIDNGHKSQLLFEDTIDYQSEVQLELVKPSMFVAVQQQLDQRMECQGLVHRFDSNGRLQFGAISYIHVQSFLENVLVRAFHTFPESSAILTSESRFSVAMH